LRRYQEALNEIARQAENRSHPVDEYNTVPLSGGSTGTLLTITPIYEYMPEKIESIIVNGPAAAVATLTLGDRQMPLVMPASGVLVIAPVAILLGRNDPRQLASAVAGIWFVELMGIADKRFQI
jgi:alpha-beta hydrolase superfamily lysophospholipase